MLCKKPFKNFACGQCIFCRVNRMQDRANRLMLEATQHEKTCFVTLTYDDKNAEQNNYSLNPDDVKYFIMRLRAHLSPLRLRYFACGEYGGTRFGSINATREINPHYHLAIYGLDYTDADLIDEKWGLGLTDVKFLEPASALYLAKYVTKKMTGKEDDRLKITDEFSLYPEFQRMSLKPGLGAGAIQEFSKIYNNPYALSQIDLTGDVPHEINIGDKKIPLTRYLKTVLRKSLGFQETGAQPNWALKKSLQALQNLKEIEAKASEMGVGLYSYKNDIKNMKRSRILERLKTKQIKDTL